MPEGLDFYAHLLYGADDDQHRERLRQEWEDGGRKYFMSPGFIAANPGIRPQSYWAFDWTAADHPEAMDCRCQAECIMRFDLCDEHERKQIIKQQIVEDQLEHLGLLPTSD